MNHEKCDIDNVVEEAKSFEADEREEEEQPESANLETNSSPLQKKKKSLSGRPTRPLSAYNLFYRHERTKWLEALKADPETMKIPPKERFLAMGRHISKCWNELPESEKQKYKQQAAPYYKEFLEEKKQYKAKKSKEAIAERKLLEAAAQREMSQNPGSNHGEYAAGGQYEPITTSSVLNSIHPSFHHLPQENVGIYASMAAQPQPQSVGEALSALIGVQPGRNVAFLDTAASTTGVDFSHNSNTEQHLAQHPITSTAFFEILHREQQHILMNKLLASNQQIQPQQQLPSSEELQRVLELTCNIGGSSNLDTSIAAILDLLRRSNSSGF